MFTIEREGVKFVFADTSTQSITAWLVRHFNDWEPFTFKVFQRVKDSEKICIDVGAWIGLTSIWLAKNFKHVVCVDGDKESVESLQINLKASGCENYTIINKPITHEKKDVIFGSNIFMQGSTLNDSTSQIKSTVTKSTDYTIESITFKELVMPYNLSDIGFIKCDIEGGEEDILEDLLTFGKEYSIPILLSFHITWWKNKDISRFKDLLTNWKCTNENDSVVENICDFLKGNPMANIFFERV